MLRNTHNDLGHCSPYISTETLHHSIRSLESDPPPRRQHSPQHLPLHPRPIPPPPDLLERHAPPSTPPPAPLPYSPPPPPALPLDPPYTSLLVPKKNCPFKAFREAWAKMGQTWLKVALTPCLSTPSGLGTTLEKSFWTTFGPTSDPRNATQTCVLCVVHHSVVPMGH